MPAFIITGMVRWSREQDLFVEADEGQIWLLDLPHELVPQADGLLHDRVTVEGGRIGPSRISVDRIARWING
jgi:hypothetical protein